MGRIWEWRTTEAEALTQEVKRLICAGHIVALPTETFYALAAHPYQEAALRALFALKERPPEKPVLLLVADAQMLEQVARNIPPSARVLMERFWPGPLTLILPARPDLSSWLTGGTGTVGVRRPRQTLTCRLIAALGFPVTGTSANRAGQRPLTRAKDVEGEFGEAVPLIVDTGPCPGGLPSTIVDLSVTPPRLVRAGAIPTGSLQDIIPDIKASVAIDG